MIMLIIFTTMIKLKMLTTNIMKTFSDLSSLGASLLSPILRSSDTESIWLVHHHHHHQHHHQHHNHPHHTNHHPYHDNYVHQWEHQERRWGRESSLKATETLCLWTWGGSDGDHDSDGDGSFEDENDDANTKDDDDGDIFEDVMRSWAYVGDADATNQKHHNFHSW